MLFLPDPLSIGMFAIRLAVAAAFFVHGPPKWRHPEGVAQGTGLPLWFGKFLGGAETLGSPALFLGVLVQPAAIGLALIMMGALRYHLFVWKTPFTAMGKGGWEFDLLLLASLVALVALGGGGISLEEWLM